MPNAKSVSVVNSAPLQGLDAPIGYPQTGLWPATFGLTTLKVTAGTAQTVNLPHPAGTNGLAYRFDLAGLSGETVLVQYSADGTTLETLASIKLSDGTLAAGATMANGSYVLPKGLSPVKLVFTKSSTTEVLALGVAWMALPK